MSPRRSLLRLMQKNYYRMMMPYWQSQFSPYIGDVKIGEIFFRFYWCVKPLPMAVSRVRRFDREE